MRKDQSRSRVRKRLASAYRSRSKYDVLFVTMVFSFGFLLGFVFCMLLEYRPPSFDWAPMPVQRLYTYALAVKTVSWDEGYWTSYLEGVSGIAVVSWSSMALMMLSTAVARSRRLLRALGTTQALGIVGHM